MAQWHKLMVDLCSNAMTAKESVDLESKVERRTACRQGFDFAFWREHKDFGSKKVELNAVKEVHCIRLWVIKYFLYGAQPIVEFALVLAVFFAIFIFPMGSKALLSVPLSNGLVCSSTSRGVLDIHWLSDG